MPRACLVTSLRRSPNRPSDLLPFARRAFFGAFPHLPVATLRYIPPSVAFASALVPLISSVRAVVCAALPGARRRLAACPSHLFGLSRSMPSLRGSYVLSSPALACLGACRLRWCARADPGTRSGPPNRPCRWALASVAPTAPWVGPPPFARPACCRGLHPGCPRTRSACITRALPRPCSVVFSACPPLHLADPPCGFGLAQLCLAGAFLALPVLPAR